MKADRPPAEAQGPGPEEDSPRGNLSRSLSSSLLRAALGSFANRPPPPAATVEQATKPLTDVTF